MHHHFRDSLEAKKWLRGYCLRNGIFWLDLVRIMERTTRWRASQGQWIPFARKLLLEEELQGVKRPREEQRTLKPQVGPILAALDRMTSEEELRDYLATLLFDEIVTICTAVKQKRSSRGKGTRRKVETVQEPKSTGQDGK